MGSKSKRRHAQKQYNRAQNKPVPPAGTVDQPLTPDADLATAPTIMTPKELRKAEKERAKQAKRQAKEQAKIAKAQPKKEDKGEKKPFFLVRFFRWIGRGFASMFSELKKVHWPTFQQIMKATGIVLGIVVLFGILLFGIWVLMGLLHYLLLNGNLDGWKI